MFVIMGATGQVGGAAAEALLAQGRKVRVVVRNEEKAKAWRERGAEAALADYRDADALQAAFDGAEAVFYMNPPVFYPSEGFPETKETVGAAAKALAAAGVPKFVALSSVGAHRTQGLGIIESLHILEEELAKLPIPSAFLRAAWFQDNCFWDVEPARGGQVYSFLHPLDRKIPMIATTDIGQIAAETLQQSWDGVRYLELQGPEPYSPNDIAAAFARLLKREVKAVEVPRSEWAAAFVSQGGDPDRLHGRIEMLDGFNKGWIDFERQGTELISGRTTLEETLKKWL
ncbi:NmrA family NAD(P)-binding protein [Paenibacillus humicola]|uniref:NmrA family NAD(P)-binding protein n=1 Tax=Paenibacillus humicola TaxID=3110540 RepID=UPI00237C1003|nr:NmrA family NAD(P)-binding protein [Paenibacillus humicola]